MYETSYYVDFTEQFFRDVRRSLLFEGLPTRGLGAIASHDIFGGLQWS